MLLGHLVKEQKLSKSDLASMILSVLKDSPEHKKKLKRVKILIKTFLKNGSLIPKTIEPELLINI